MNERIKEMSKQAHLVADATYAEGPDSVWLKEYNKKFAELIVRECDRYARSVWEHGPLLGRDLLIHFGIEEMSDD
jgi:hypothetical protein